jgi:hypothetical protein
LNIILVTGANARARTLTVDWHHWALGGALLLVLFLTFTVAFNLVTLKWAAEVRLPWLQAIMLEDQREAAARIDERVQGHLNAMRCDSANCRRKWRGSTDWGSVSQERLV